MYCKVPVEQCIQLSGRQPIGTRWVDVNKSDDSNPQYRSRLVAKEINTHKRDDLFAATPPLEAQKLLLSFAMTKGIGYDTSKSKGGDLSLLTYGELITMRRCVEKCLLISHRRTMNQGCVPSYLKRCRVLVMLLRIGNANIVNG